ncbi:hypothetical protein GGF46_003242 [Coemansia sp. RSA 552]|nr:hypothetical protein GGF46_003242 [Coemansia sp. RSA 552]
MRPSSTPTTPVSLAAAEDPVLQIMDIACGVQDPAAALSQLHTLFRTSPDVRAALRLVPPAYMDGLSASVCAGTLIATASKATNSSAIENKAASGSQLLQLLVVHTLDGNDSAASMLTMLLSNGAAAVSQDQALALSTAAASTLIARVQDTRPELDSFAELLRVLDTSTNKVADSSPSLPSWVGDLVTATADAAIAIPESTDGNEQRGSQVLCLLAQLLTQYAGTATRALAMYAGIRRLARHVIRLLSQPSPLIAAPALHVLTRILLHPQPSPSQAHATPLTVLADSLGGKLFDHAHMDRTLVLAADLCLNCHAADHASGMAAESLEALVAADLRVLEAVAGVVRAVSTAQSPSIRSRFLQTTALTPAIDHLVAMAAIDRRYLDMLLHMANSMLLCAAGNAALPLVAPLYRAYQDQSGDSAATTMETPGGRSEEPSIVDMIADMVISGIEDIADTVPRLTPPPVGTGSGEPSLGSSPLSWPRVASDEGGCGWFIGCNWRQCQEVVCFLQLSLSSLGEGPEQGMHWVREFVQVVTQVLRSLLAPTPSAEFQGVPASDPFVTEPAADLHLQTRTGHQVLALGTYYWTVRPVLSLALDLISQSPAVSLYWTEWARTGELSQAMQWADWVEQGISGDPTMVQGQALFAELGQAFSQLDSTSPIASIIYPESQVSKAVVVSPPDVATPSSTPLSCATSPGPEHVIGIHELRAASAGLGISAPGVCLAHKAAVHGRAAVIWHWARTCQAELASMLLLSCGVAASDEVLVRRASRLRVLAHSSRLMVAQPPGSPNAAAPHMFASLSLAVAARQQTQKQHTAQYDMYTRRLYDQHQGLAKLEARNVGLVHELEQARVDHTQQQAHWEKQQALAAETEQRLEADVLEWKEECMRTRQHLDQSEDIGHQARQQLLQLTERQQALQESFAARQEGWEQRKLALTENIRKLEIALSEAVARLREQEASAAAERAASDQTRDQLAAAQSKLAQYCRLSESLYTLTRMSH